MNPPLPFAAPFFLKPPFFLDQGMTLPPSDCPIVCFAAHGSTAGGYGLAWQYCDPYIERFVLCPRNQRVLRKTSLHRRYLGRKKFDLFTRCNGDRILSMPTATFSSLIFHQGWSVLQRQMLKSM